MGLYIDFARKAFWQNAVYKADIALGIVSNFLFLFLQVSVWSVLFTVRPQGNPISLPEMRTYIILSLLIQPLTRSTIDRRIAERVDDGSIGNDFIRPVNFKYYVIAEDVGQNLFVALFQVAPACLVGIVLFGLHMPDHASNAALALLVLAGGMVINFYFKYVIGLLSFWFQTRYHVDWLFYGLSALFSGATVPLWFYPPALRAVSELFPWQFVHFAPLSIFLETASGAYVAKMLALQVVWLGLLWLMERGLWRMAQEKIEVYGG